MAIFVRLLFPFCALCALTLSAQAGDAAPPSVARDPHAPPPSIWDSLSGADEKFAIAGGAKAGQAGNPSAANAKAAAGGGANDLHLSLHMFGGAVVGGNVGR